MYHNEPNGRTYYTPEQLQHRRQYYPQSNNPYDKHWGGERKKPRSIWDVDVTGYTKVPQKLLEKLATLKLRAPEYSILLVIIRKTLGWNKEMDSISLSQFVALTGCDRRTIQYSLKTLQNKGIIQKVSKNLSRRGHIWCIVRNNTQKWPLRTPKNYSCKNVASPGDISAHTPCAKLVLIKAEIPPPTIDNPKERELYIRMKDGARLQGIAQKLRLIK